MIQTSQVKYSEITVYNYIFKYFFANIYQIIDFQALFLSDKINRIFTCFYNADIFKGNISS